MGRLECTPGRCGNTYIREEQLATLLATVVAPIQISREVAGDIAAALAGSEAEGERYRQEVGDRLEQRRRTVAAKLDRGYDDYVSGRISEEFFRRKSQEWETDLQTVDAERARVERPRPPVMATAEKILELAKQAEYLYKQQDPPEQRRLLETVLSNCSFDRGNLCPTYSKPFDLLVRGNETGDWRRGWDSKPVSPCSICNLQIPNCQGCRKSQRCRGALLVSTRREVLLVGSDGDHWRGPRPAQARVFRKRHESEA